MINIYLANGQLDIYDNESVSISKTPFRFSDSFYKPFTNDFTIPKTQRNMDLLGFYNMLDFDGQLYGNALRPAVLDVNGKPIDIFIQFVSVTDNDITICVYENTSVDIIGDNTIGGEGSVLVDSDDTIIRWNSTSLSEYPQLFKTYNYGMPFQPIFAQRHPCKPLRDILLDIADELNISLWTIPSQYQLIATKKNVCPQNKTQIVEAQYVENDRTFYISGGQHVTNDLEYNSESKVNEIVFNRSCKVRVTAHVSWERKSTVSNDFIFSTSLRKTSMPTISRPLTLQSSRFTNHVDSYTFTLNVDEGDIMSFNLSSYNKYEFVEVLLNMEITDYQINKDDYDIEMRYVGRLPRIKVKDFYTNETRYFSADGVEHSYSYNNAQSIGRFYITKSSLCYFGYWCNVPKMKITDLLFNIQWLLGQQLKWVDYSFQYQPINNSTVVTDAMITEMRPHSDMLGRKNYIRYDGEENPTSITNINSMWLEESKDIHKSIFGYVYGVNTLNQYKLKVDEDGVSVDFNEIDKPIVMSLAGHTTLLRKVIFPTMGISNIKSVVEVDFETYNDEIFDCDFCYIDGRKFMIVEITKDFISGKNNVTAILSVANVNDYR